MMQLFFELVVVFPAPSITSHAFPGSASRTLPVSSFIASVQPLRVVMLLQLLPLPPPPPVIPLNRLPIT